MFIGIYGIEAAFERLICMSNAVIKCLVSLPIRKAAYQIAYINRYDYFGLTGINPWDFPMELCLPVLLRAVLFCRAKTMGEVFVLVFK